MIPCTFNHLNMKKDWITFLLLLCLSFACKAKVEDTSFDKGSNIKIDSLTSWQVHNLYKLGKVWGFVKYHHPEIAAGNVNWDYELFRILPKIWVESDEERVNGEIVAWLSMLGKISTKDRNTMQEENIKLSPDTAWIKDEQLLGTQLSEVLLALQMAELPSSNYYISLSPNVGNPNYKNEQAYKEMSFTDDGLKLLSLYRYWNMIAYFFPNRHLMDEDWDEVLQAFIPKIIGAEDELSYKLTLLELIGKVKDTHANIWQRDAVLDRFWGTNIAPVEVKFIEGKPVVTSFFEELEDTTKLQIGDIITHINGEDVMAMVEEKIKYCPASNPITQLRDVARRLLRDQRQHHYFIC